MYLTYVVLTGYWYDVLLLHIHKQIKLESVFESKFDNPTPKKKMPPTPYHQSQPTILCKLMGIINPTILWHASWETLWTLWILQNFTGNNCRFSLLFCRCSPRRKTRHIDAGSPHATDLARMKAGWKMLEIILEDIWGFSVTMFGMCTSWCKEMLKTRQDSWAITPGFMSIITFGIFCPHFPNGDTSPTLKSTAKMFSAQRMAKDCKNAWKIICGLLFNLLLRWKVMKTIPCLTLRHNC